jgi:hypothetical protein
MVGSWSNREAVFNGLAIRLHQTVPAVEGCPTAVRPAMGSRNV